MIFCFKYLENHYYDTFLVGTWSEWSSCIVTQKCSNGTQSRTCIGPGDCPSGEETVQLCTTQNDEECSSVTLVQEGLNCEQHCNKTGYNIHIIHYNEISVIYIISQTDYPK